MLKVILFVFLSMLSVSFCYGKGGIPVQKISHVAFQTGGFFLYAESGSWNSPDECSNSNAIVLLASDSNYDKAYSLLLAAYMSGKAISGYSDGCTTFDGKTYSTIRGFKYLVVH
jgi:hypothetical protein